jgi:uncharacterized protein (TIGR02145 family)
MKHLLTLTLLCFGLLAQAQIPSYVPTNGLVGWWPFNGNANDESGNNLNGVASNINYLAGPFNYFANFNGNNSIISIPNSQLFSTDTFSISLRVNMNISPFHNPIQFGEVNGPLRFSIGWQTNQIYYAPMTCSGGWGTTANSASSALNLNKWYHIVWVTQGTRTKFYLDGISIADINNAVATNCFNQRMSFFLGGDIGGGAIEFYNGNMDELGYYNRALSAAEVQQLYSGACAKPSFTSQPQNKSVAQGQTTTFAVQVDSASSFQWQMDNGFGFVNLVNSSLFSGVSTSSLTVKGSNSIDGYAFRCIATSCNADTSNASTLTVTSSASAASGTVSGVPGLINYQGSALDSAGKPMKNQTISLKLSVLDSSSTGAAVYVESHNATTNGSGHFAIQIGGGTALLGTFDSVGWANGRNKYLKTELSQNGTWVNLGTSQLVSVPYALVSGRAIEAKRALEIMDSAGNIFSLGYSNGQPQPTLVPVPGSGSAVVCGQAINYAGESYPTVQIGTQCWFQKNLNVGMMIQGANDQMNNSVLEKYCYNNDTANCAIYGGLYQWAEAVQYQNGASNTTSPSPAFSGNVKGICPTGWHVPSDGEWCTLTTFLDSTVDCSVIGWTGTNAGGKLRSTSSLWNSPNTGATNSSGFSGLPSGYFNFDRTFNDLGVNNQYWSSTKNANNSAFYRHWTNLNSNIFRNDPTNNHAFSIRCIKD